jgi:hypothetical protein
MIGKEMPPGPDLYTTPVLSGIAVVAATTSSLASQDLARTRSQPVLLPRSTSAD